MSSSESLGHSCLLPCPFLAGGSPVLVCFACFGGGGLCPGVSASILGVSRLLALLLCGRPLSLLVLRVGLGLLSFRRLGVRVVCVVCVSIAYIVR